MVLYDEKGNKESFSTRKKIGGNTHGTVYRTSETECIKVYKKNIEIDEQILKLIKELKLRNFYEILKIYYSKSEIFTAIKMRYYQGENIDILTMPTEYILDNLFRLQSSIDILTKNNVGIEDTHSGNVIIDSNNITVIDVDLYSFNRFRTIRQLEAKNIEKLGYLFKELFIEAVGDYHSDIKDFRTASLIDETFSFFTSQQIERTYKKLVKYQCY